MFTPDGVEELIEILTEACQEAGSQKKEIETNIDLDQLEKACHNVMENCYDKPIYDSVIILTSCLVRLLHEAVKLNNFSGMDGNTTEH